MDNQESSARGLKKIAADLKEYTESRLQLMVLKGGERISVIIAESVQNIIVLLVAVIGIGLLLLSLSFYVGELTGSTALGFFIVAAAALMFSGGMMLFKPKGIKQRIHSRIMRELLEGLDEAGTVKQKNLESSQKDNTDGR